MANVENGDNQNPPSTTETENIDVDLLSGGKNGEEENKPSSSDKDSPDTKTADEETPQKIVPEVYEDFKLPEGVVLDNELTDGIKALAKKYSLSQEEAQEMADLGASHTQKLIEQQNQFIEETRKDWVKQAQVDKEYGGEKLQENLAVARKGLENYASEPLKELLKTSGLGAHPEMIRLFFNLGKLVQNDKPDNGNQASETGADRLSKLYPSHFKS